MACVTKLAKNFSALPTKNKSLKTDRSVKPDKGFTILCAKMKKTIHTRSIFYFATSNISMWCYFSDVNSTMVVNRYRLLYILESGLAKLVLELFKYIQSLHQQKLARGLCFVISISRKSFLRSTKVCFCMIAEGKWTYPMYWLPLKMISHTLQRMRVKRIKSFPSFFCTV